MTKTELKKLFCDVASYTSAPVTVCGWFKTIRVSKSLGFIELNDGTCFKNLQVVFEENKLNNFKEISKLMWARRSWWMAISSSPRMPSSPLKFMPPMFSLRVLPPPITPCKRNATP